VKILVSWLREFVDPGVPVQDLAWRLHMAGFELAGIEPAPGPPGGPEDAVIDLEITANRPDCLSVLGIARETATLFDRPLRLPAPALKAGTAGLPVSVTIEAPDLCPRYAAAVADIRVGPSPAWMQRRLQAAGVRAISNIVDITNYVLLELGHPMHAFDLDRLAGASIVVRRARAGETIRTLDGVDRALAPDMLVIADAGRAQAVAGVMGGGEAEVSLGTRRVALESAWFLPTSVRRTSRRLGLSTEASYRFERGADPNAPVRALARCAELIEQTGAGTVLPGWLDEHPAPRPRTTLALRAPQLATVLGTVVPHEEVERVLAGLGCTVVQDAASAAAGGTAGWRVETPSWRGDLQREIDLIEEVARIHGYDRLPTTFPPLASAPARPDARLARERAARRSAASMGFNECVTFTFVDAAAAEPFVAAADIVAIANPLSEKFAVLRPAVVASLVDVVAHNRRREQRDVRLFEAGARFTTSDGERRAIGLAWTGAASPDHWSGTERAVDFFDVKGAVEAIAGALGLAIETTATTCAWLVAGRAAAVDAVAPDGTRVPFAWLGQLDPAVAGQRGLPPQDEVYVAEIDLDAVAPLVSLGEDVRVAPLPRFPSVVRDVSLLVPEDLPASSLRATILAAAPQTLTAARAFARYQGKGVADGHVSLSFRLTFRAPDRTLTDGEVQEATERIVAALAAAHGATRR
jgi:phenylalanyl-tRNA synthetase beta chain